MGSEVWTQVTHSLATLVTASADRCPSRKETDSETDGKKEQRNKPELPVASLSDSLLHLLKECASTVVALDPDGFLRD